MMPERAVSWAEAAAAARGRVFDGLPDDRARAAVNKAIEILADDPRHPLSVPYGDDESVRVIDATPYVRVRYVIQDTFVLIIVFELTDFRPPLLGAE